MNTFKITLLLAIMLCSLTLFSQETIEYSIIKDDPQNVPDNYLYLYYFDYQGGLLANPDERHNGLSSLGVSANLWQHVTPALMVQTDTRFGFFGDAASVRRFHMRLEAGGGIDLSSKTKEGAAKVNVRAFKTVVTTEDQYGNYKGWYNAVGMEQIQVPATYEYQWSARAGLQFQNGSYDRSSLGRGTYSTFGIYGGIARESKVHVVTQLLNRTALSAQYLRYYADVFFYPVATTNVDPEGKKAFIGARVGAMGSLPGMKNFINYMTPKIELGFHALNGGYFQIGLGINLYNS